MQEEYMNGYADGFKEGMKHAIQLIKREQEQKIDVEIQQLEPTALIEDIEDQPKGNRIAVIVWLAQFTEEEREEKKKNIKDIAEQFNVTTRTVYRAFDAFPKPKKQLENNHYEYKIGKE